MNTIYQIRHGFVPLSSLKSISSIRFNNDQHFFDVLSKHYHDVFHDPQKIGFYPYFKSISRSLIIEQELSLKFHISLDLTLSHLWNIAVKPFLNSLYSILLDHCDDQSLVYKISLLYIHPNFLQLYSSAVNKRLNLLQHHHHRDRSHRNLSSFYLSCFFIARSLSTENSCSNFLSINS